MYDGLVEDLSEYAELIPEEAMGSLAEAGVFDGKTYFMPYRPNAEINYYNTDMFEKYGLTPPTTWDELYETAKTLKEQEGIGRLCLKLKLDGDAIELAEFIRSAGGDPLVLNDEGSVEAFTFLQKLWPELSEDTLTASFSSTNTYLATDEWQKPFLEATKKAMEVAEPLPHVSYWPEAQQAINDAAKEICINGADVQTTLDKYAAQIADYAQKAGY